MGEAYMKRRASTGEVGHFRVGTSDVTSRQHEYIKGSSFFRWTQNEKLNPDEYKVSGSKKGTYGEVYRIISTDTICRHLTASPGDRTIVKGSERIKDGWLYGYYENEHFPE